MENCLTPDDLLNYPRCCNLTNQICCPNEGIQEALDCAYQTVSKLLCFEYCPYEDCKIFSGNGSCKLFMDHQIQTITSVEVIKCEDDKCACPCKSPCEEDQELPCISGSVLEYRCGGEFPCGTKNIKICGTWGTVMPAMVKKAIILLAMEEISPGIMGLDACDNVKSVTWDDFSVNFTNSGSPDYTTGFREIDQMLIPYVNSDAQVMIGATSNCTCKKKSCRSCNNYA